MLISRLLNIIGCCLLVYLFLGIAAMSFTSRIFHGTWAPTAMLQRNHELSR